jgi:hypothetical protein
MVTSLNVVLFAFAVGLIAGASLGVLAIALPAINKPQWTRLPPPHDANVTGRLLIVISSDRREVWVTGEHGPLLRVENITKLVVHDNSATADEPAGGMPEGPVPSAHWDGLTL